MERDPVRKLTPLLILAGAVVAAGLAPLSDAGAQERYVRDHVSISFRTGPGSDYRILRFLPTGTPVTPLPLPEDHDYTPRALEEWTYVRNNRGEEGWVQGSYLMDERPASERIGEVEAELRQAREQITALEEALAAAEEEKRTLQDELTAAQAHSSALETDLQSAREGYELVQANEELQQRVATLLDRNEQLESSNRELLERSHQEWFLVGAGVLTVGILLGLILPHLRRRRSAWSGGL